MSRVFLQTEFTWVKNFDQSDYISLKTIGRLSGRCRHVIKTILRQGALWRINDVFDLGQREITKEKKNCWLVVLDNSNIKPFNVRVAEILKSNHESMSTKKAS